MDSLDRAVIQSDALALGLTVDEVEQLMARVDTATRTPHKPSLLTRWLTRR